MYPTNTTRNPLERPQLPLKTCPCCEGTGRIEVRWPDDDEPETIYSSYDTCPACDGTGEVPDTGADDRFILADLYEN